MFSSYHVNTWNSAFIALQVTWKHENANEHKLLLSKEDDLWTKRGGKSMDDRAKKIHWIFGQSIVHTIAIGLRKLAEHSL